MDEYEKKIEQLSTLLNEEEAHHRELATQLEGKVAELEKAIVEAGQSSPAESSTPSATVVIPESKSKSKILEQRIVEMTISLEEKDRRIFELDSEIDKLKVELNQIRVEASRVPELEATVNELDNQVASLQHTEEPMEGHELDSSSSESSGEDLRDRILELEQQVKDLDYLVTTLRSEKTYLTSERDMLAARVVPGDIDELRQRIVQLEEELEISEMNRKILRDNFEIENDLRVKISADFEALKASIVVPMVVDVVDPVAPGEASQEAVDDHVAEAVSGVEALEQGVAVEAAQEPADLQVAEAAPHTAEEKPEMHAGVSGETTMEGIEAPSGEKITPDQAELLMKSQMAQIELLTRQVDSLQFSKPSPKACTPCFVLFSRKARA